MAIVSGLLAFSGILKSFSRNLEKRNRLKHLEKSMEFQGVTNSKLDDQLQRLEKQSESMDKLMESVLEVIEIQKVEKERKGQEESVRKLKENSPRIVRTGNVQSTKIIYDLTKESGFDQSTKSFVSNG